MKSPNTLNPDQYSLMLFKACRRISKKLQNLSFEEECKCRAEDDKGDEEKALKHYFNGQAIEMAIYALEKSPEQLKNIIDRKTKIN